MSEKKKKKFLTVYTVSYTENSIDFGMEHNVIGSYLSRGDAIRECAGLILEKLESLPLMRNSFLLGKGDKTKEVVELLKKSGVPRDDIASFFGDGIIKGRPMPESISGALRPYLKDVLGGESFYGVKRLGLYEIRFDIDENDVECADGLQLWTCITSGADSDRHDQEFEQPFPEVFLSEEEAIECALEDLRQCLDGYGREQKTEILCEARDKLENDGYYEFDLNDSTSRRWDIWNTPIDIGQGSGKIQRK